MHGLETIREINAAAVAKAKDAPKHLWAIARPMNKNSGMQWDADHHRGWEDHVIGEFGGATFLPVADGAWKHGNLIFREPMQEVRVLGTRQDILALVHMTMTYYDQLAIFWYKIADAENVAITHRNPTEEAAR